MSWLRKRSGRAYFSGGIVGNYGIRHFLLVGAWARRLPVSSTKYSHLRLFAVVCTTHAVIISTFAVLLSTCVVLLSTPVGFLSTLAGIYSTPAAIYPAGAEIYPALAAFMPEKWPNDLSKQENRASKPPIRPIGPDPSSAKAPDLPCPQPYGMPNGCLRSLGEPPDE